MLIVETIAKVRRAYFSDGKSIKAICRELRLSRKVVRKVIRSGETSFSYERAVQPRSKLGQWTATLDELLEANAAKPAREQLTLIRIFEELRGRGYGGGHAVIFRTVVAEVVEEKEWIEVARQCLVKACSQLAACVAAIAGVVEDVAKCVAPPFDLTRVFSDFHGGVFGTPPLLTRTGPRKRRLHLPRKFMCSSWRRKGGPCDRTRVSSLDWPSR